MKKQPISWEEHKSLVNDICRQIIISKWVPEIIVGLTRGGLLPAVMISHYFDTQMNALDISLRDHKQCVSNCGLAEDAFNGKRILIVDDINDGGATLEWIVNDWQSSCRPDNETWANVWNNTVKFATIVDNLSSDFEYKIDYTGMEINKRFNPVWIDFPYENWWTK